jgi:uncharacterized protein with PQ loop repeat
VRIVRTRSSRDLSITALCAYTAGLGLWLVYGILLAAPPIVIWNAVSFAIYLAIVTAKLVHDGPLGRAGAPPHPEERPNIARLSDPRG